MHPLSISRLCHILVRLSIGSVVICILWRSIIGSSHNVATFDGDKSPLSQGFLHSLGHKLVLIPANSPVDAISSVANGTADGAIIILDEYETSLMEILSVPGESIDARVLFLGRIHLVPPCNGGKSRAITKLLLDSLRSTLTSFVTPLTLSRAPPLTELMNQRECVPQRVRRSETFHFSLLLPAISVWCTVLLASYHWVEDKLMCRLTSFNRRLLRVLQFTIGLLQVYCFLSLKGERLLSSVCVFHCGLLSGLILGARPVHRSIANLKALYLILFLFLVNTFLSLSLLYRLSNTLLSLFELS